MSARKRAIHHMRSRHVPRGISLGIITRLELERVNPGPTALILILFIDMKLVQKAMHDGREHDPHHGDENQSAKQRVQ